MWGLGKPIAFRSPLSAGECLAILEASLGSLWNPFSGSLFVGRVSGNSLLIRQKRRYNNSWQIMFVGQVESDVRGSRIIGRFRTSWFVLVFMPVWLAMVTLIGFGIAGTLALEKGLTEDTALSFLFGSTMLGFGIGLWRFGLWLSRNEQAAISAMLRQKVQAERLDRI